MIETSKNTDQKKIALDSIEDAIQAIKNGEIINAMQNPAMEVAIKSLIF